MTNKKNTILIVGASRGIGFGLVTEYLGRGWDVIATERKPGSSSGLAKLKAAHGESLALATVDIDHSEQIQNLATELKGRVLDILFVNAGISDDPSQTVGQISTEEFTRVLLTNALSPLRVMEAIAPLVTAKGSIAVMSSALGSVGQDPAGSYEVYGASKAALNKLLRAYAARAGGERSFFALMPGWVRTDMGGPDAPVSVEDSAKGLANVLEARSGTPGLVFVDYQNNLIPW